MRYIIAVLNTVPSSRSSSLQGGNRPRGQVTGAEQVHALAWARDYNYNDPKCGDAPNSTHMPYEASVLAPRTKWRAIVYRPRYLRVAQICVMVMVLVTNAEWKHGDAGQRCARERVVPWWWKQRKREWER